MNSKFENLLNVDENNKLNLNIPNLPNVKSIVVSMIGCARMGKSTFINMFISYLHQTNMKVLETSSGSDHCTTGVNIYNVFLKNDDNEYNLIFLDCQGLSFLDSKNDDKFLSAIYMISDIVVFHTSGYINNETLNTLTPLCLVADMIQTDVHETMLKPKLYFRMKDYSLNADPRDFITKTFTKRSDQFDNVRGAIKKLFPVIEPITTDILGKNNIEQLNMQNPDYLTICNDDLGFKKCFDTLIIDIHQLFNDNRPIVTPKMIFLNLEKIVNQINTNLRMTFVDYDYYTLLIKQRFNDFKKTLPVEFTEKNHIDHTEVANLKLRSKLDDILEFRKKMCNQFAQIEQGIIDSEINNFDKTYIAQVEEDIKACYSDAENYIIKNIIPDFSKNLSNDLKDLLFTQNELIGGLYDIVAHNFKKSYFDHMNKKRIFYCACNGSTVEASHTQCKILNCECNNFSKYAKGLNQNTITDIFNLILQKYCPIIKKEYFEFLEKHNQHIISIKNFANTLVPFDVKWFEKHYSNIKFADMSNTNEIKYTNSHICNRILAYWTVLKKIEYFEIIDVKIQIDDKFINLDNFKENMLVTKKLNDIEGLICFDMSQYFKENSNVCPSEGTEITYPDFLISRNEFQNIPSLLDTQIVKIEKESKQPALYFFVKHIIETLKQSTQEEIDKVNQFIKKNRHQTHEIYLKHFKNMCSNNNGYHLTNNIMYCQTTLNFTTITITGCEALYLGSNNDSFKKAIISILNADKQTMCSDKNGLVFRMLSVDDENIIKTLCANSNITVDFLNDHFKFKTVHSNVTDYKISYTTMFGKLVIENLIRKYMSVYVSEKITNK